MQKSGDLSGDLSGLPLLYSSAGDRKGMLSLAKQAKDAGRANVAFVAYFISGYTEECVQLLVDTGRVPEAAFFARTYLPSKMTSILELWKADLKTVNEKAAEALADPARYPNLFADLDIALQVEESMRARRMKATPAANYLDAKSDLELNLIDLAKDEGLPQARANTIDLDDDDYNEEAPEDDDGEMKTAGKVAAFEGDAEEAEEDDDADDVNISEDALEADEDDDVEAEEEVEEEAEDVNVEEEAEDVAVDEETEEVGDDDVDDDADAVADATIEAEEDEEEVDAVDEADDTEDVDAEAEEEEEEEDVLAEAEALLQESKGEQDADDTEEAEEDAEEEEENMVDADGEEDEEDW